MSIEMSPPNTPTEALQQETTPPLEKSYLRRRWDYATRQWREHQKVELIATTIGAGVAAFVIGSIAGGIVAGVGAAVLTFIIALAAIFIVHFLRAPAKLDNERRSEIIGLNVTVNELQASVRELEAKHHSEMKALKRKEKEVRYKLYRRYRKILTDVSELLKPRVSIDYYPDQPSFFAHKTVGRKDYRIFRVKVTNIGGAPLYNLRAQLKLVLCNFSS
jgi:hypothetical protein